MQSENVHKNTEADRGGELTENMPACEWVGYDVSKESDQYEHGVLAHVPDKGIRSAPD